MKLRIKTQAIVDKYLREMAKEAGVSVEYLAEIAVYNLVGCWLANNSHDGNLSDWQSNNGNVLELRPSDTQEMRPMERTD